MSLAENLRFAQDTCAFVASRMTIGAGNQPDSQPDAAACVRFIRSTMVSTDNFIPHLALRALANGCGNCGEQAAIAFEFLRSKGISPVNYMNLNDPDGNAIHSFVVISFSGCDNTCNWGQDAVICDPWDNSQAYPAGQIAQQMTLWQSGSTVVTIRREE
jgi:hypothetical protein